MSKLIIVRGVSGSGKSTWSRQYATDNERVIVVNRDKIRELLFGSEEAFGIDEDLVTVVQDATIRGALSADWTVVVDNTNVIWYWVEQLAKIASEYRVPVEIVDIECTIEEAQNRNYLRGANGGRMVPPSVIDKQWEHLQSSKDKSLG